MRMLDPLTSVYTLCRGSVIHCLNIAWRKHFKGVLVELYRVRCPKSWYLKMMSTPFCASVLLITKGDPRYKHYPNFASFQLFWIETYSLYSFTSIANQKSVRYSVSISYFTNIAVQNVNKVRACAQEWTPSLTIHEWNVYIVTMEI
jgi:uncharacterized protein (UPF0332 family)